MTMDNIEQSETTEGQSRMGLAGTAWPVFYRTYSRMTPNGRESWEEMSERAVAGLVKLGKLDDHEAELIRKGLSESTVMPSGRWLWVGGTEWLENPENFMGAYNCTSTNVVDWNSFGMMMEYAMMGCGTGAVLEPSKINNLPVVIRNLSIQVVGNIGEWPDFLRLEATWVHRIADDRILIEVGDSRKGWVNMYKEILKASSSGSGEMLICIDFGSVRPAGEMLKGFGGVSNPVKLEELPGRMSRILNGALGRRLNSVECCLLIDEAASVVVAGNVRRSAGMRQFSEDDHIAGEAKANLWQQAEDGSWRIDPDRDALRMANHTRVFHHKPTEEECIESVQKQYYSGEGAIQWAGEAIVRSNVDILNDPKRRDSFLEMYVKGDGGQYLQSIEPNLTETEAASRLERYGLNPCFAAGTMVLTREGHFPIESLVGKVVEVWDGDRWTEIDNFRMTARDQPVFQVQLGNGQTITATEYHSFILEDGSRKMLKLLLPGDRLLTHDVLVSSDRAEPAAYLKGFLVGDGSNAQGHARLDLYTPKAMCKARLLDSAAQLEIRELVAAGDGRFMAKGWGFTPSRNGREQMQGLAQADLISWSTTARVSLPKDIFNWSLESKCEFIAGVMDADGCALDVGGCKYQISSVRGQWIADFQLLLKSIGIDSKQNPVRPGGIKDFGPERGGEYPVKDLYRLTIPQLGSIKLSHLCNFSRLRSFADAQMKVLRKLRWNTVELVEFSHIAPEIYCCTVDTNHQFSLSNGITVGNCGEIIGSDFACNLAEVHLNQLDPDDPVAIGNAFQAAGISVAVLLNHQFQEPRFKLSREKDPIVGVSFTGLFDFFVKCFGVEWLEWWAEGRPDTEAGRKFKDQEAEHLSTWREIAHNAVWAYCDKHDLKRPNRCTTVQPAGCLDKDALRVFDQGLLYADEIVSPGSGETKGIGLSVRGGLMAKTAIANEPLNLVKVTLNNGRTLRMTPDHKLMINGQWVEARSMGQGMEIAFELGHYATSEEALLLKVNGFEYSREHRQIERGHGRGVLAKTIATPSTMSEDLAYFLGALFGNGCLSDSKYRVRFSHGRLDVLHKLAAIGGRLFDVEGIINADHRGGRFELCYPSKQLYDWLHLNGLAKIEKSANIDRIPEVIRRSSHESILSFIAGLIDTDGCPRNNSFSIDIASEGFIRNLQQVGEAVGLCLGISHNTRGKNFQGVKSIWTVHLYRSCSNPEPVNYLNKHSIKLLDRPVVLSPNGMRYVKSPYKIKSVEFETTPDYSYDFAVDGSDYDDSWYWQGGLKSHNTKSLLTGASPGWHPPKAQRFIRRITFRKDDPVALACIDYGYSVIPSQADKDEKGTLLDDPHDPRCTEWLIEIPVAVSWADLKGADQIEISHFSALAQFDFYMQVQRFYTTHNCFSRDTEFLTAAGVRSFADFEAGDTVTVLNGDGDWVPAEVVRTNDARMMYEITLRQGKTGKIKRVVATGCHRWPVRRASCGSSIIKTVKTSDLKVGHRMVTGSAELPDFDRKGVIHGLVYGDGSQYKNSKGVYHESQVYLCHAKRELTYLFEGYDRCHERNDLNQTRIYGLPLEYKSLPTPEASQEYVAGFVAGLLASDGNICGSSVTISTSDAATLEWLQINLPRIGTLAISASWCEQGGYENSRPNCRITIPKESFPENLILRSHHRGCYESRESQPCQWRVEAVKSLDEQAEGWCVMEPITNQFTLAENILTFNTSATIELREDEIEPLGERIYEAIRDNEGYISTALLARFDDLQTFPRLPFEPIDKATYDKLTKEVMGRQVEPDFGAALAKYDKGQIEEAGPAGCDSDKCLMP